ncbi:hypothetical protein RJ639_001929 [Escallonia herrerae]|uniref:Uncharacterized protein n=1 Tax=Escallonia herrerae TaxID=1293975 RepID=A0AA88XJI6_9ASTE|nr:hypothetical protein RJ639_001929 [Escallonia herrerae]
MKNQQFFVFTVLFTRFSSSTVHSISNDDKAIVINGYRRLLISGSIHLENGFNWESCNKQGGWYNSLMNSISDLAGAGVTPSYSVALQGNKFEVTCFKNKYGRDLLKHAAEKFRRNPQEVVKWLSGGDLASGLAQRLDPFSSEADGVSPQSVTSGSNPSFMIGDFMKKVQWVETTRRA